MLSFLVETALLTHGLPSVTEEELQNAWKFPEANLAWVEQGKIVLGDIKRYLIFRKERKNALRIDRELLNLALEQGFTGALTASGTMAVCQKRGLQLAVTCGMGGIGDIKAEELCPDLPALAELPVVLLATGPKDMLDVQATVTWLTAHGVTIGCMQESCYTGYLFKSCQVAVERWDPAKSRLDQNKHLLLCNPIPESKRIANPEILQAGIAAGKRAELEGAYYHPAANQEFDRLTKGVSSQIQLESLIQNVQLAQSLVAAKQ